MERGELEPEGFRLYDAITSALKREAFSAYVTSSLGVVQTMARQRETRIFIYSVPFERIEDRIETINIVQIDNLYDDSETQLTCTESGKILLISDNEHVWLDPQQPDHQEYINTIITVIDQAEYEAQKPHQDN